MLQDVRFAFRMFAKSPGFTSTAVVCLAVAIAANTTVFSCVEGMWTRPLPVEDPGSLVRVMMQTGEGRSRVSYPEYLEFREQARSLDGLVALERRGPILRGEGFVESTMTNVTTANYFQMLGVGAFRGRVFTGGESGSGAQPVAVMSYNLWQRRFGGDASIVGKSVRLGPAAFTVMGVAPRGFRGTELWADIDFWIPMESWEAISPGEAQLRMNPKYRGYEVFGRLRRGAELRQARAEVEALGLRMQKERPEINRGVTAVLKSNFEYQAMSGGYLPLVLLGVVLVVLVIACANVAGLLLARSEARGQEIAVRLSMGCSSGRLTRQFLVESLLLGAMATAAGLLAPYWLIELLPSLVLPPNTYVKTEFRLDGRVLVFSLAVSLLTVLLFGLFPAWRAGRSDPLPALKSMRGLEHPSKVQARELMVVGQVALSVLLLAVAGSLIDTLLKALRIDLGFERKNVLLVDLSAWRNQAFQEELLARLKGLPAVREATIARRSPLAGYGGGMVERVEKPGRSGPPDETSADVKFNTVGLNYFRLLGIRLLRGRDFTSQDIPSQRRVVILSDFMARRFFPGQEAVGQMIKIGPPGRALDHEVVGVVADAKINYIEEPPEPYFYLLYGQDYRGDRILMVETAGDALVVVPSVRGILRELDPRIAVLEVSTLSALVRSSLHSQRLSASLVSVLGGVGLLLAMAGLYGVMSYAVSRRTREVGIRMALGARQGEILRLVMGRGLRLVLAGCLVGLAVALGSTPRNPLAMAAAAVLLVAVAALAIYLPSRRATRVDPVVALRYE